MTAALLRLDEAVDLGHALVQEVARAHGIRVLFLKGPALHRLGLRAARISADIDVLVEPARFGDLCDVLAVDGWRERPELFFDTVRTVHSRTFVRDGWPCDLDVHSHNPGLLADPADAFETLWRRRMPLDFAHRECDVPDRVASVAILALHSLRGARSQSRHGTELEALLRVALTDAERAELADFVRETRSAGTLETVLPRLGVDVKPTPDEEASADLRDWRERVAAGSSGSYYWLSAFRSARWTQRPRILWRAVWPTRRDLLLARPETIDTPSGRTRARLQRWGRGIRSLPATTSALRTARRSADESERGRTAG